MIRGHCLICGDTAYSPTLDDANRAWTLHYLHHHTPSNGRRYGPTEGESNDPQQ